MAGSLTDLALWNKAGVPGGIHATSTPLARLVIIPVRNHYGTVIERGLVFHAAGGMVCVMNVLVVEDEMKLAGFIRKALGEHGFAVTVCHPNPRP